MRSTHAGHPESIAQHIVTQADRDAAADYFAAVYGYQPGSPTLSDIRAGRPHTDSAMLVQTLARHRESCVAAEAAQGDEVRDALARIVKRVADGEWADPGHRALMTDARELLATLTKGARDAG